MLLSKSLAWLIGERGTGERGASSNMFWSDMASVSSQLLLESASPALSGNSIASRVDTLAIMASLSCQFLYGKGVHSTVTGHSLSPGLCSFQRCAAYVQLTFQQIVTISQVLLQLDHQWLPCPIRFHIRACKNTQFLLCKTSTRRTHSTIQVCHGPVDPRGLPAS